MGVDLNSRQRIVQTARGMLLGEIEMLKGCREIASELGGFPEGKDPVFLPIVGVESEMDDIPDSFDGWTEEASKRLRRERDEYIDGNRAAITAACAEIVRKFGESVS